MPGDANARRPPLVLLAGAEEWSSRSLASILSPKGYAILRSYTDRQTIELAHAARPDAIIADIGVPESGGVALCQSLRNGGGVPPSTPLILIAPSIETRQQRLEALRAGASDYWGQPLDTEELVLRLEHQVAAKRDVDRAREEGLRDAGTGLYNARGLEQRLRELHALAGRRHGPLACVVFALEPPDLRKPGGVRAGPRASDLMAEALRSVSRGSDVVARLGSSEYAVVTPEADVAGATVMAERLMTALERLAREQGASVAPVVRAGLDGVADFGDADVDPAELLRHANAALAGAGAAGRIRRFEH